MTDVASLTLARPGALAALALLAPLVALHLYRARRRRLLVAFVPLLRETAGPTAARGRGDRLQERAALVARGVALTAVVLALAGPRRAVVAPPPRDLVVVLDADLSTRAIEARPPSGAPRTRFDAARDLARAHLLAHRAGRVAVWLAGEAPTPVVAPTEDAHAAADALASLAPARVVTDLGAAIVAARATPGLVAPRVVVVSSRAMPEGLADARPGALEVVGAGTADDDQGIRDLSVALADDGVTYTVRWRLGNAASEPRVRRLDVAFEGGALEGGASVASPEVAIPARGVADVALDVRAPRDGGLLLARLVGRDVLAEDDLVGVRLPPPSRPSVLVVHGGAPRSYVTAVLEALGDRIDLAASGAVRVEDLAAARPRDVTLVDGVVLPEGALTPGAWVFLVAPGADAGGAPFRTGRVVRDPLVWRAEAADALLVGVDLSTALVARATTLEVGDARAGVAPGAAPAEDRTRVLARVEGEAVVAAGETGGARWLAFGLDPQGSDLPLRAALPLLLRNAVLGLARAPVAPLRPWYRAGEPFVPRTVLGVADGGPSGAPTRFAPLGAQATSRADAGGTLPDVRMPHRPGPDAPLAPRGGPWRVRVTLPDGSVHETVVLDLDPRLDVAPARPPAPAPPPAPPPAPDDEVALRLGLLLGAVLALLVDLASVRRAGRARFLAPAPSRP